MTPGPVLPCPRCRHLLGPESWIDAGDGICLHCQTGFEFVAFPALTAARAAIAPQAALLEADSVCFFHAENRAEAICEGCGRLLCSVCTVPFAGQKLCPTCIAATKSATAPVAIRNRVLYDSIALTAAVLPLVLWPFTLVTAPVALGLVVYGWNKPSSLVRGRSRGRLIAAGLFALAEIAVWVSIGVAWWLQKK